MKRSIQDLFYAARGMAPNRRDPQISRKQAVDRAARLAGAPEGMTERQLEVLEVGQGRQPLGDHVRYFSAALDISLFEVLVALDLWPPVKKIDTVEFMRLCKTLGINVAHVQGKRLIVDLP